MDSHKTSSQGEEATPGLVLETNQGRDINRSCHTSKSAQEPSQPQLILTNIEELVLELLRCLGQGIVPDFNVPSLKRGVKRPLPLDNRSVTEGGPSPQNNICYCQVSLTAKQGTGAHRYTRLLKMLTVVHELVRTGRSAPQRDIYYQLKGPPLFTAPRHIADSLEDVSMLLGVPRSDLGVSSSTRGIVAGLLLIQQKGESHWTDCAGHPRSIPGDCAAVQSFAFQSSARYIVVVEKDAVFQRLLDEGFCESTESIIVTARGMPDFATRTFLSCLAAAFPDATLTAVVDWNPCGVAILKTYKWGSDRGCQGPSYALPNLKWLALCASQVDGLPDDDFQPLSEHDRQVIRSLRNSPVKFQPTWIKELDIMETNGVKAEIEAAYHHSGYGAFARDLAARLQQGVYV